MKQLPVAQLNALRPTWLLKPGVYHTLGSRTLVMGILNVTDDSFSDGGTCSLCVLFTTSLFRLRLQAESTCVFGCALSARATAGLVRL